MSEGGSRGGGQAAGDRRRPPRPRPLRRYGQNHLVDLNILRAIVEQAAVRPDDVVLEVGAAGGQLTRPLLERAAVVHAFEIDRRYLEQLEALAGRHANLRVHAGDALAADLGALEPAPTALVANLAYNIAIPLIMTSIAGLPSLRRWAVMVQKELAERLFATPSTKAYAAVSVLTQLACRREHARAVPPSAFRPRPRVDSSFVTFVRREDALAGREYQALGTLVRLAFGQRRKVLGNSLAGARPPAAAGAAGHGVVPPPVTRDTVAAALRRLGLPATARPEELSPPQWVQIARLLGWLGGEDEAEATHGEAR